MSAWDLSFTMRAFILDFCLLSVLLILGTVGRRYVPLFQRFLIPNNLLAGFAGLLLGPELLAFLPFSIDRMGIYVYHLLALTFISVGLQAGNSRHSHGAINLGFIQIMSFMLQALVGLGVAFLIVYLVNPDFPPSIGMLLPLGFGMGPGIAYSVGQSWAAFGFADAGSIGLTIAALGFLVAYFTGIIIVNKGIRRGHTSMFAGADAISEDFRTGILRTEPKPVAARLTFSGSAIEPLTFHLALVGAIYIGTYFLVTGLAHGLTAAGLVREVPTLWSFHFIIANLLALLTRRIMNARGIAHVLDDGFIQRMTGLFADFLITTAIMAISLSIAWEYVVPILVMCTLGTLSTYLTIRWVSQRVFHDYHFERFVGIYGEMTGTISSGLALVRVADPEYTTPVAEELALSSGFALAFGFPLLLLINLPFTLFDGELYGFGIVFGLIAAYLGLIMLVWRRFGLQSRKTAVF